MSLFNVFEISGSAMSAQSIRLNTIASNMANADVVGDNPDAVYRARHPVFETVFNQAVGNRHAVGVRVDEVVESTVEPSREYSPGHPMADDEGYVYRSSVNTVEEMANMISASRSYESSVRAMETTKQLILRTLQIGQ
jgi:flagellar basal-body rod protein FlgC